MEQQPVFPEVEIPEMQEPDIRSRVRALCHAILILFAAYALVYALYGVFEHNGYPLIFLIGVVSLFSLTLIFGLLSGGKPGPHAIAALLFGLIAGRSQRKEMRLQESLHLRFPKGRTSVLSDHG